MAIFLFIFFLLLLCYAFLIDYYRRSWNQMPIFESAIGAGNIFISVLIPIRNEVSNLPGLIQSLLQQTYPPLMFEIIFIDDHSTDDSWEMIQNFKGGAVSIQSIRLADLLTGKETITAHKKFAIEKGIEKARGELIVTTDADCSYDPEWLSTLANYYVTTDAKFIAAPVRIKPTGSLLSIFQSLDFLTLQGITGASVYKKFHTMCNGANLAYEKNAFYSVGGFAGIDTIPSGDDMLLMYKIFRAYPGHVFYLKSKSAIVTTQSEKSWTGFFNQRIRWASKATHYNDKRIFWTLLLVYVINVSFLILAIAAFWKATWLFFLILLLVAKIIIEFPFVNAVAIFFHEQKLMKYFPFMQPIHIGYTIVAGWLGKFGSYEWKGRRSNK